MSRIRLRKPRPHPTHKARDSEVMNTKSECQAEELPDGKPTHEEEDVERMGQAVSETDRHDPDPKQVPKHKEEPSAAR